MLGLASLARWNVLFGSKYGSHCGAIAPNHTRALNFLSNSRNLPCDADVRTDSDFPEIALLAISCNAAMLVTAPIECNGTYVSNLHALWVPHLS